MTAPAARAQEAMPVACAKARQGYLRNTAKATIADPAEELYDVKYVKLVLSLTNVSTTLSGSATTTAAVTAPGGMSQYVFELNPLLAIDSCRINGATLPVATLGFVRSVMLPVSLGSGAAFTAQVFYHGQPVSGTGFNTTGIISMPAGGGNMYGGVTFTVSEPYESSNWWPCKMSLRDKIDSSETWLTVDDTLRAGSNGLLQAVTPLPGRKARYEWKSRSPINYYNISFAVGKYTDHSYYVHFTGSSDSMLVQSYIYDNPNAIALIQADIDSLGSVIDYFSTLFGRYPFWREKYGHCTVPLSGGQENQTMTSVGIFPARDINQYVLAHELGHQWWGDNVGCASFHDIWLSEGFASYCEDLYWERFQGLTYAAQMLLQKHRLVISRPDGSVYVDDTASSTRIFDARLTYDKGASVMHMLRYLAGSDAAFFRMLQAYQRQYGGSSAYTADFKAVAEASYGRSLDSFFRQWIYGQGVPTYYAVWNQKGDQVFVQLSQAGSFPASVPAFDFPVEVKLSGPSGDTTVTIPMAGPSALVSFSWSRPVDSVIIDPADWIPDDTGYSGKDIRLDAGAVSGRKPMLAYPNPAAKSWQVTNVPEGSDAVLTDITGRAVWQAQKVRGNALIIDAAALPEGLYLLRLRHTATGLDEALKLVHSSTE